MEAADVYLVLDYALRVLASRQLDRYQERALLDPERGSPELRAALLEATARAVAPNLEGSVRRAPGARPNLSYAESDVANMRSVTAVLGVDFASRPNTYGEPNTLEPTAAMLAAWRQGLQEASVRAPMPWPAAPVKPKPTSDRWDF